MNTFYEDSMSWKRKLKNYEKFMDFHGCELVLMLPELQSRFDPYIWGYALVNDDDTNFTIHSIVPEIFKSASKNFNFKDSYQPVKLHSNNSYLYNYRNENVEIIKIDNIYKEPNIWFELLGVNAILSFKYRITSAIVQFTEILLVTPAEAYTPYEKLLLPFDRITWILLVVAFSIVFCSIFIINNAPKAIQNVFYGSEIQTPSFNIVSIFFGVSQTKLPGENFSRNILLLFVFFCLIFRTCYQSMLFEFMTSEPRRPPPKTIQDLIDRNYTVFTTQQQEFDRLISNEREKWPNIQQSPYEKFHHIYLTQARNASAKAALLMTDLFQLHVEHKTHRSDKWIKMKNVNIHTLHAAIATIHNAFYFKMIERTVNYLKDAGIILFLIELEIGEKHKYKNPEDDPKVLKMTDLSFGFNIWIGFCFMSTVTFLIEMMVWLLVIIKKWKKKRKHLKFSKIFPVRSKVQDLENIVYNEETFKKFKVKITSYETICNSPVDGVTNG